MSAAAGPHCSDEMLERRRARERELKLSAAREKYYYGYERAAVFSPALFLACSFTAA